MKMVIYQLICLMFILSVHLKPRFCSKATCQSSVCSLIPARIEEAAQCKIDSIYADGSSVGWNAVDPTAWPGSGQFWWSKLGSANTL